MHTTTTRRRPARRPCTCNAYPFPHRPASGDCPDLPSCPDCGSVDLVPVGRMTPEGQDAVCRNCRRVIAA